MARISAELFSPYDIGRFNMTNLQDLPVELIIDIVKEFAPNNENRASVGNNAGWTSLEMYRASLKPVESNPSPGSPVASSIYLDLLSLRSTCSLMNSLCVPILYRDLDVISKIPASFDEWYDTVVKPYAKYAKTVRLSATDATISDEQAAKIVDAAMNADEILLYHPTFKPSSEEDAVAVGWWRQTNKAILKVAEEGRLRAFGIYSNRICQANWYWTPRMTKIDEGAGALLYQIAECPAAQKSLKKLDIVLYDMLEDEYDAIRENLTALTSLAFVHVLRKRLDRVWSPAQRTKWAPNSNLTHLYLKKASGGYAPHIPHLVRHFKSLKYLLISICGDYDDVTMLPSTEWYEADDALWKVRKPLDVLHLEHMDAWEIQAMGEIPSKTILVANLRGYELSNALEADNRYFPLLETIRVEPRDNSPYGSQFRDKEYDTIANYCNIRGVALLLDAKPTLSNPRH